MLRSHNMICRYVKKLLLGAQDIGKLIIKQVAIKL